MNTLTQAMRKLGFQGDINASPILFRVTLGNVSDGDGQGTGYGLVVGFSKHELLNRINYAVLAKRHGAIHLSICNQKGESTCSLVVSDTQGIDISSLEELVNHKL